MSDLTGYIDEETFPASDVSAEYRSMEIYLSDRVKRFLQREKPHMSFDVIVRIIDDRQSKL